MLIVALAIGVTLLLTLIRFALDLLIVVGVIWGVGWSAGTVSDWLSGERVSLWTIVPVSLTAAAVMLVLEWVGGPRLLTPFIEQHTPAVATRAMHVAAEHGWGQVVLVPNLPFARSNTQMVHSAAPSPPRAEGTTEGETPLDALRRAAGSRARSRQAEGGGTVGVDAEASSEASSHTSVRTTTSLEAGGAGDTTTLRLVARVTARSGEIPEGTVTFRRGRSVLGVVRLDPWGRATLHIGSLPTGAHELTAEFGGRGRFEGSTSPVLRHEIGR